MRQRIDDGGHDENRHELELALARRALRGETAAFEQLYRSHAPMVYSLACRMIGRGEADDVTQDVFVRTWQKLALFHGTGSFAGWLRRIAVNTCVNRMRRIREATGSDEASPDRGAAESVDPTPLRLDLEAAIGKLPARARAVFVLHDVEGHDHQEVAAALGVTVGTSKSQLHRARMLLRAQLRESDPES